MSRLINLYKQSDYSPWNESKFAIACSGGYDSMALVDFFVKGNRKPILLHVNHATGNDKATDLVANYAEKHNLQTIIRYINPLNKQKKESWEEFWRNERLKFFHEQPFPILTGHNLNDAMETWVFSSMHGTSKLIPYNNKNIYRPLLTTLKSDLFKYVIKNGVEWAEDHSNENLAYSRNRIRHNIIPEIEQINKGFSTVIKKKYQELVQ